MKKLVLGIVIMAVLLCYVLVDTAYVGGGVRKNAHNIAPQLKFEESYV